MDKGSILSHLQAILRTFRAHVSKGMSHAPRGKKAAIIAPVLILIIFLLMSCAPAATPQQAARQPEKPIATEAPPKPLPTQPSAPTQSAAKETAKETALPAAAVGAAATATAVAEAPSELPSQPTFLPTAQPQATEVKPQTTPTVMVEERVVEMEWPASMRLGDSDVVRLALSPSAGGYTVTTEYPEHSTVTQTLQVKREGGYDLFAVARLDGVGFELSPQGDLPVYLPEGQRVSWRWSLAPRNAGQQRLAILLRLRWVPVGNPGQTPREVPVFSHGLEVRVLSFFGLTRSQAVLAGFFGLFLGSGLGVFALVIARPQRTRRTLQAILPNPSLAIELPPGLQLKPMERNLLKSLFQRYSRLLIQQEFLSGYSGARTFLALPVRADGKADAYTIAKLGEKESIRREFANYENFVKDSLPPITARIQHPPVTVADTRKTNPRSGEVQLAALQYTFIGEPGSTPTSLRQALLAEPEPRLLYKLFDTFGPNWWMQRRPYTFRLAIEYDTVLPTHLVIEPDRGKGYVLDGSLPRSLIELRVGDLVTLRNFETSEVRSDGRSLSLRGKPAPGQPPLRVRWLSLTQPGGATGRVVSTRSTLLHQFAAGCQLYELPDPLERLPFWMAETVTGSQSTIHGDLNLENVLAGPGDLMWLIDFAQTREGHTLFDFAHLEAEIIAHILAPQISAEAAYLDLLIKPETNPDNKMHRLLAAWEEIALRCLFNPSQPREYWLALAVACLGALKYTNLDDHARHLLYLTAAYQAKSL